MSSINPAASYLGIVTEGIQKESDKEKIKEALNQYAENQREQIAFLAQKIIRAGEPLVGPIRMQRNTRPKVSHLARVELIHKLRHISENREAIVTGVAKLIGPEMNGRERNLIIDRAMDSDATICPRICEVISEILNIRIPREADQKTYAVSIKYGERIMLFSLLNKVGTVNKINSVASSAFRLFSSFCISTTGEGAAKTFEILASIEDEELPEMINLIIDHFNRMPYCGHGIDIHIYICQLINILKQVPRRERASVMEGVLNAVIKIKKSPNKLYSHYEDGIKLVRLVSDISVQDRAALIDFIQQFVGPGENIANVHRILMAFHGVPHRTRTWASHQVGPFIRSQHDQRKAYKFALAICRVDPEQMGSITRLYNALFTESDKTEGGTPEIIELLAKIGDIRQREQIVLFITQLPMFSSLRSEEKALLIAQAEQAPAESRAQLFRDVLSITSNRNWINQIFVAETLAMHVVPQQDRANVATFALQALAISSRNQFHDIQRGSFMQLAAAFANIPPDNRQMVLTQLQRIAGRVRIGLYSDHQIVAFLNQCRNHAENVVTAALETINEQMHGQDILYTLQNAAQRIVPWMQPQGVGNEARLAREGVNVHAGNRDHVTRNALTILFRKSGKQERDAVLRRCNEFLTFLRGPQIDLEMGQLAARALFSPREEGEEFGPLCRAQAPPDSPPFPEVPRFSVLGFTLSGEVLIAALWHYIEQIEDEKDRVNAKISMVKALSVSFEGTLPNGHLQRVCNQGKTQRLLVAVLQGREPGIVFDEPATQLPAAVASNMFFNIQANRDIRSLRELLEAGRAFCSQNPLVPLEPFLDLLRRYAAEEQLPNE